MNEAMLNFKIKKSQNRTVTVVTSVNGRSFEDIAPGIDNQFENNVEAIKKIQEITGTRLNDIKTKRVGLASYSVRS